MGRLLRAPEPAGSWMWFVGARKKTGLAESLSTLEVVTDILCRHELLTVGAIEICWEHPRVQRRPRDWRTVPLRGNIDTPECAESLLATRPPGASDARMLLLQAHGTGTWLDARGNACSEADLVIAEATPLDEDVAVEVAVYHDVWARYAFNGFPHPEVHRANAPRLATALKEIESTFDAYTEPGDHTYFGAVKGYGISDPEPFEIVDGRALDRTDKIV
ncbi:hypothetical protein [Nocardiopsis suaedae]|uniref:Uncharacterized protein n=1 Tax=Nocardiopsis suaedae TaxID=3018444 RepID=A0ABT4TL54_9ACTN|nr:hypothetical protein [Nocardiopsis suaedae]MDA2805417.1 hypothetical protein [Nocardiopsis suaedae]